MIVAMQHSKGALPFGINGKPFKHNSLRTVKTKSTQKLSNPKVNEDRPAHQLVGASYDPVSDTLIEIVRNKKRYMTKSEKIVKFGGQHESRT